MISKKSFLPPFLDHPTHQVPSGSMYLRGPNDLRPLGLELPIPLSLEPDTLDHTEANPCIRSMTCTKCEQNGRC